MLHIVNKISLLRPCLALAAPGDAILMIEDGVYATYGASALLLEKESDYLFYALQEDILARGLQEDTPKHINLVNYASFVELVCMHTISQTWY